jgi:hypothetical protein
MIVILLHGTEFLRQPRQHICGLGQRKGHARADTWTAIESVESQHHRKVLSVRHAYGM